MAGLSEIVDDDEEGAALRAFQASLDDIVLAFRLKSENPDPEEGNHIQLLCADPEALLAEARRQALWSLQNTGQVGPLFTLLSRHGIAVVISLDTGMPGTSDTQAVVARGVASTIRTAGVDACVFMMEAWLAPCSKDERGEWIEDDGIPADEHPGRVETVYMRVSTPQGSTLAVYEIARDASGEASALQELDSEQRLGFTVDRLLVALEDDDNPLLGNPYAPAGSAWTHQGTGALN